MQLPSTFKTKDVILRQLWHNLVSVLNRHVAFGDGTNGDNVDGVWKSAVTPLVANTDFTITHNLGRIPVGYLVMSKTGATDIYNGTVASTATQLTLKATGTGVTVNLFIV